MLHINENNPSKERIKEIEEYLSSESHNFSTMEVKEIVLEIMNLGMTVRQNQLNGYEDKSGKELCLKYLTEFIEKNKK